MALFFSREEKRMSEKNTVQVLIGGKVIRLSGYESEEYLEKVASYLNHKLGEFSRVSGYSQMPSEMKGTMLALNVADDYFKAKERAEDVEDDLKRKDKEIYDLKQELVSLQIMMDNMKKSNAPGVSGPSSQRPGTPKKH